jgi:cytochrome b pre-mRNA-processing protein 3
MPFFKTFFAHRRQRRAQQEQLLALYAVLAEASRQQWLYREGGIPDTVEGRFEALTLMAVVALRRLRALPSPSEEVTQDLTDLVFHHLDAGLREIGISDTKVPKRMKTLAAAFYERAHAYDTALDAGDTHALAKVFGGFVRGSEQASDVRIADYLKACDAALQTLDLNGWLNGFVWPQIEP